MDFYFNAFFCCVFCFPIVFSFYRFNPIERKVTMSVFEPKVKNIHGWHLNNKLIPEGSEFLFACPKNGLMIAESRNCECGSQAYINSQYVHIWIKKDLHELPFYAKTPEEFWCDDDGREYCSACA